MKSKVLPAENKNPRQNCVWQDTVTYNPLKSPENSPLLKPRGRGPPDKGTENRIEKMTGRRRPVGHRANDRPSAPVSRHDS